MVRIDAHVHLFPLEMAARRSEIAAADPAFAEMYANPAAKMADLPELLAALDAAGIDRAVVAGFAFARHCDIEAQNEYLLALPAQSPGRIAALATINPGLPGWEQTARTAIDAGASGFGELRPAAQAWEPLGPAARSFCGLAQDAGLVLLWHVSEPLGHRYPGKAGGISPVDLCHVAEAFPRLRMVAAHQGGGLSFFLQMPEVRSILANIWFDTAASPLLYDEQSVWRLVALAGDGRVLFASDYPLLSPRRQLEQHLAHLPGDAAEAVCGGNAATLFFG
jgi:hypothetical protein